MKLSKYNYIHTYEDSVIFFNAKTCALARLTENGVRVIEEIQNGVFKEANHDKELISAMKHVGCIIDDDLDELKQIKYMHDVTKYNSTIMGLTIAPTMDCNYRCVYCFEKHSSTTMSKSVQDAICAYVEKNANHLEKLFITWFGGEPMLQKDTVYNLSQRLISLCDENNVKYTSTMVSNGSLITEEDVPLLKQSRIDTIQITLDGPGELHDKRRVDISGKSDFDTLLKNINLLLSGGVNVRIRVNIDNQNCTHVDELLVVLKQNIVDFEKVLVSFGHVQPYTEECKCVQDVCINDSDYADTSLSLCAKALEYGFKGSKMLLYPHMRMVYCGAGMKNSIIIDAAGEMYKCSSKIGNKKFSYGNIVDGYEVGSANFLDWLQWDPFSFKKCRDCKLLPLCMGGCQALAKEKCEGRDAEPVCEVVKYNIDSVLYYYYNMLGK